MKTTWQWLVILAVLLCATQAPAAKHVRVINKGNNTPTTPVPTPKTAPYWTVDAVDQEGKTVTLTKSDGKDSEKYKVTAMTKITINNQPDKLENMQAGMKVENMTVSTGTLSALALVTVKDADSGGKKKHK